MKILFLVSRVPYALDKGDKLRAFHQIRMLAQKHEILLFALSDEPVPPGAIQALEVYCQEVVIFPITKTGAAISMAKALVSSLPMQVAYFYNQQAQLQLDKLVKKHQPDHIYCQLVRMAAYIKNYPRIPKTLDYMDAFSVGLERRLQQAPFYKKPIFLLEYHRLKKYEAAVFGLFTHNTIISGQDRSYIQHQHKYNIHVVPNGVDAVYFNPEDTFKKYQVLFCGNMGYAPNVAAAQYLVNNIMPLVWERYPETTVLLAGKEPTAEVKALATAKIAVSGTLPDIREAYNAADMLVAPLFMGSGQQNKILEAMAMGMPCITTQLVNNAIGAEAEKEVLLAEAAADFATQIIYLLQQPALARAIGQKGRQLVRRQYSWQLTTARLESILNSKALTA